MPTEARIIDRGRGPEIAGTRITVYNVLDYIEEGWHPARIALFFSISTDQVQAAIDYIAMHRDEVMPEYREMLAHDERGNPPELQAKLDAGHAEFLERARRVRESKPTDVVDARDSA